MRRAGAGLVIALALAACARPNAARVPGVAPGVPDASLVQAVALRADAIRLAAGAGPVPAAFAGPAAQLLQREALRERRRGEHLDTVVEQREVVHWSAVAGQAAVVVSDTGRQRLVGRTGASAWDSFVDQWEYTLRWSAGWRVWDAVELPPAQWWPA